ncbi:MAG: hypothetical protein COU90_02630 [Candidatus Ryanbacteria bacterium CG10_big_fil_rev_8_21_14_0_10_43_42]|uniref:TRAM domain-containing protein n=1 Tax=Candidatus Ryanbacteria bacterium CG10_big_fil_rev_8_21_14_0_10_43_42 TaxID=1974864 RepID=A0A2M8KWR6_9BACT|nr:MAG: hypothetical protein COU90_02630 [Candidatus Ryanbacteria bacterium CG10_big_fil_rev_8_21_14_0_10_43_42]
MNREKIKITIENMSWGGDGIGYEQGKEVHVAGVLPGEVVEVLPYKKRGGVLHAHLLQVEDASPDRRDPKEEYYYRTGSPWQCIPYEKQLAYKKELLIRNWYRDTGGLPSNEVSIERSFYEWGYRNKLEFSFDEGHLAFHVRGRRYDMQRVAGSVLGNEKMNECAQVIVREIRKKKIPSHILKSLVIRYSFLEDTCIAVLYVKNKNGADNIRIEHMLFNEKKSGGFYVVYSDPRSPASVATEVVYRNGSEYIEEQVGNNIFSYHYNSFFQVNPSAFGSVLEDMRLHACSGGYAADMYAGVGTIGISLAGMFEGMYFIESDVYAREMIQKNGTRAMPEAQCLKNGDTIVGDAERQDLRTLLQKTDTVIIDPPRSGLHPRVMKYFMESPPRQIIYVSCNPKTQARDWRIFRDLYTTSHWRLYDLYPQTPHVESMLILSRIE